MGLHRRKIHELRIVEKKKGAYVNYGGMSIYLGKWDREKGEPAAEACERFEQLKALWRVDPSAKLPAASDDLLIEIWADWLNSPERPRTQKVVVDRTDRYLFGTAADPGPHFTTRAADFDGRRLLAWQSHLCGLKDASGRQVLSRDTIARCVRLLRACFDWAMIQKRVTADQVYELAKVPPPVEGAVRENVKRRPVAREIVDTTLPFLTPPLRAAVEMIRLTCSRPSEILSLRVGDVRRSGVIQTPGGVVLDLDALGVWCAVKDEHKTDDTDFERAIFFGPKSQAILAPLLDGRGEGEFVFSPAEGWAYSTEQKKATRKPGGKGNRKKPKGESSKWLPGEAYQSGALAKAIKRVCPKAKVRHWTPYQLRHAAFKLVQAKFGRDAARAFGGHQVGGATEDYAGRDLMTAARVALAMG